MYSSANRSSPSQRDWAEDSRIQELQWISVNRWDWRTSGVPSEPRFFNQRYLDAILSCILLNRRKKCEKSGSLRESRRKTSRAVRWLLSRTRQVCFYLFILTDTIQNQSLHTVGSFSPQKPEPLNSGEERNWCSVGSCSTEVGPNNAEVRHLRDKVLMDPSRDRI